MSNILSDNTPSQGGQIKKVGLTPHEASQYLGLSVSSLQKMRSKREGAVFIKYGEGKTSRVYYPFHELEAWANRHLQQTA
jgi:hypothetical protein